MSHTDANKHNKKDKLENIISAVLIIILISLTVAMMGEVNKIQGNARVVNYAGIIRGATQREMKLEIAGQGNDDLIEYLDDIFSGLMHGGGKYELTKLDDEVYNERLNTLNAYWDELKDEIKKVRDVGYENTDIISMSEEYFNLADQTVGAAEDYSQECAMKISRIEKIMTVVMVLIVIMLIKQSVDEIMLMKNNKELAKKAYIDLHTGLPNKSRCEELLMNRESVTETTSVVIFDLNGLKEVNDTLGHIAGDTLIMNFASIIRTAIPEKYFVGRYGGDEFIAILENADEDTTKEVLKAVKENADNYNKFSKQLHIEYAYGYAVSSSYSESNLKILLEKADKNMYKCKAEMKGENAVR